MRQGKKQTAWRKSRAFGDVHGGRKTPKLSDGIFRRTHSLQRPAPGESLPFLIEENPSRDYFFPLSGVETLEAIKTLPSKDVTGITHVWLRRARGSDLEAGNVPLAEYVCGSGVHAVVLYPWRRDLHWCWGRSRPKRKYCRTYEEYCGQPIFRRGWWYFVFTSRSLRRFFVEQLIYHEVGHHVDRVQKYWSKAKRHRLEEFADQYAMRRTATATYVLNRLEKQRTA